MKKLIKEYKFNKELELLLTYFSDHIKKSKSRSEAANEIDIMAIVITHLVDKYYE